MTLRLRGAIPALTTPFRPADRALDLDGFRRLCEIVIGDGVHGLLVNGCTGESWALSDEERMQVFRAAVETSRGRVPIVGGAGAMLPDQAIAKCRQAAEAGCDAVMIQPPYYIMPGPEEVMDYYAAIIAATPLPVVVYNIPRRTGINLTPDQLARLVEHPKVIALKESSKDFLLLSEMIRRVGDKIGVFAGYAALLGLAALAHGAVGYMDSATPVFGAKSRAFFDAATGGDIARARTLQSEMVALNHGFFGVGTFPAGVKAALDMLGRPGGVPRPPIRPLEAAQKARVRAALVAAGLLAPEAAAAAE